MGDHQQALSQPHGNLGGFLSYIISNLGVFCCVAAVGLGVIIGLFLQQFDSLLEEEELYIAFPVEVLMNMLEVVTIPLIATSIVIGVSSFRVAPCKKIASRAAVYFVSTTLMSVTTGLVLVVFLKPGVTDKIEPEDQKESFSINTFLMLIRNIFPVNLIQSFFKHFEKGRQRFEEPENATNVTHVVLDGHYASGMNILAIIYISLLSGLALNTINDRSRLLVQLLSTINQIAVEFLSLICCYLPLGLLFMTINRVFDAHDWQIAFKLMKFVGVVATGLIVHGAIVLPLLYLVFAKRNPCNVIYGVFPALQAALLLSSSAVTMTVTSHCCKESNKVNSRIISFMLPIATNININGTALYEAVAVVFIAQLNNVDLDFYLLFTVGITAAAFSFISRGAPARGAIMPLFVLNAAGLPARDVWILVAVEWMLDHFTTVVNVLGDCIGVALVQQLSREELRAADRDRDRTRTEDSGAAREQATAVN